MSNGHAQTVCMITDLLAYAPNSAVTVRIIPGQPNDMIRQLAETLLKEAKPLWLPTALKYIALARRFDGDMVFELLISQDVDYIKAFLAALKEQFDVDIDLESLEIKDLEELAEELEPIKEEHEDEYNTLRLDEIQQIMQRLERYSF